MGEAGAAPSLPRRLKTSTTFGDCTATSKMNSIRHIRELNKRELESGVYVEIPVPNSKSLTFNSSPEASWHADYHDTAYIYIGGLPLELSEGDIITIFSQFGEPTYINLVRDKETGKSKGFAFLKYEDQRSTDLAVDNLGGAVIMNRTLKVDHTRYKKKDDAPDEGQHLDEASNQLEDAEGESRRKRRRTSESESEEERRPMLKEERELAKLIREHDEDDPMKAYLIQEKKEELALALAKVTHGKRSEKGLKHRHHHRSRRSKEDNNGEDSGRRSRHRTEGHTRRRSHSRGDREDERTRSRAYEPEKSAEHRSGRHSPRRDNSERDHKERQRRDRSLEDNDRR